MLERDGGIEGGVGGEAEGVLTSIGCWYACVRC